MEQQHSAQGEQQRRTMLFFAMSMALWVIYVNFVLPVWFPRPPRALPPDVPEAFEQLVDRPADALRPANAAPIMAAAPPGEQRPALAQHPSKTVQLGSLDPESGYFLHVTLTTQGAAIQAIELNDPRYPEFGKRGTPLRLIGHDPLLEQRTFSLKTDEQDQRWGGSHLDEVNWELIPAETDASGATFRLKSVDGQFELRKRFELAKTPDGKPITNPLRDSYLDGYQVQLTISAKNLGPEETTYRYALRGPVGLPLEDASNSYKHRDVRMGFLRPDGEVDASQMSVLEVVKNQRAKTPAVWQRPVSYIGIDTQYFAALVRPKDELNHRAVAASQADVLEPVGEAVHWLTRMLGPARAKNEKYMEISVALDSGPRTLAAGEDLQEEFALFAGPKRPALLKAIHAEPVLDYGWFSPLVTVMLWVFDSLHGLGLSYGLTIIGLTVVIRSCLYPLSRHQALTMDRMKEHQPKLKLLHEKFKNHPESLTTEEKQEMQSIQLKMMGGCLPLLLQTPIFIALYRALQVSVDLRMAPMHVVGGWIDNLASPDRLFQFGFGLPLLGWTEFNVLPILSLALMMVNQKLTMPPALDEEQRVQQKTMMFSFVIVGLMFWSVPAGLCVYIITSSVWGTVERLLLKKYVHAPPDASNGAAPVTSLASAPPASKPANTSAKTGGYFDDLKKKLRELQELADKDASARRAPNRADPRTNRKGKRK